MQKVELKMSHLCHVHIIIVSIRRTSIDLYTPKHIFGKFRPTRVCTTLKSQKFDICTTGLLMHENAV